ESDGTFVHSYQTEEYMAALEIVRGMWSEELIHPDSFSGAGSGFTQIPQGSISLHWSDFAQWAALLRNNLPTNPAFDVIGLVPPKWEGGGNAAHFTGAGVSSVMGITATDPGRVKLLLRVLNWLAAPFGTERYVF